MTRRTFATLRSLSWLFLLLSCAATAAAHGYVRDRQAAGADALDTGDEDDTGPTIVCIAADTESGCR